MTKKSNSKTVSRFKFKWKWVVGVGVVVSILGGIAELSGFNLRSIINLNSGDEPLQLTVYVHGSKGHQDIIIENDGELIVDFGNDRRHALIGERGRTNFGEIPRKFKGSQISFGLLAENSQYLLSKGDSNYIFQGEPIYLEVLHEQRLVLSGRVVDKTDNSPITRAKISIENTSIKEVSDSRGNFSIAINLDDHSFPIRLIAIKEGYLISELLIGEGTTNNIQLSLNKDFN